MKLLPKLYHRDSQMCRITLRRSCRTKDLDSSGMSPGFSRGGSIVRIRGAYDDLSEVQFMDATTIGVIIRARNHLRAESRSLVLRSPPPWARRVLDQCDLAGLVGPVPPAPNLTVADPDLLATRHATDVALRQGP